MDRRTFIKASAAATTIALPSRGIASAVHSYPAIPSLSDLASVRMSHTFMELFNLPIAMNDWGYAQAVKSVSAIMAIAFPPYACCGIPDTPWSPGLLSTCELIMNDRLISISNDPAHAVTYQWFPHCVVREQTVDGIHFRTTMFLPPEQRAVLQKIEIRNIGASNATLALGFNMRAAVTQKSSGWMAQLPGEADNRLSWNGEKGRLTWTAAHSKAASTQGISPAAEGVDGGNVLRYNITLAPRCYARASLCRDRSFKCRGCGRALRSSASAVFRTGATKRAPLRPVASLGVYFRQQRLLRIASEIAHHKRNAVEPVPQWIQESADRPPSITRLGLRAYVAYAERTCFTDVELSLGYCADQFQLVAA